VVIAGGGPAGAATAIALRQRGIPCLVLEPAALPVKAGETIPPNALPVFQQLGIGHLLQSPQHIPCTTNTVIWGHEQPVSRHFFAEPNGNGWHINRAYFEQQLQQYAIEKGTQWHTGWSFTGMEEKDDHVLIHCISPEGQNNVLPACFAVDASGRKASMARKAGSKRESLDRLTGYYALWPALPEALVNTTFIEASEQGWWYAASLANEQAVINFMTDADLHQLPDNSLPDWLYEQLQHTSHLKAMLQANHPQQLQQVIARPASTSCLTQPAGAYWLAVGDAACTYDPLTSYGITAALGGGIYAALAISDYLHGNTSAPDAYCYVQQTTFNNCLAMLQHQYALEQRWPDSLFWQRRTAKAVTEDSSATPDFTKPLR
jgi:flavin-dependent dehydrogenase